MPFLQGLGTNQDQVRDNDIAVSNWRDNDMMLDPLFFDVAQPGSQSPKCIYVSLGKEPADERPRFA